VSDDVSLEERVTEIKRIIREKDPDYNFTKLDRLREKYKEKKEITEIILSTIINEQFFHKHLHIFDSQMDFLLSEEYDQVIKRFEKEDTKILKTILFRLSDFRSGISYIMKQELLEMYLSEKFKETTTTFKRLLKNPNEAIEAFTNSLSKTNYEAMDVICSKEFEECALYFRGYPEHIMFTIIGFVSLFRYKREFMNFSLSKDFKEMINRTNPGSKRLFDMLSRLDFRQDLPLDFLSSEEYYSSMNYFKEDEVGDAITYLLCAAEEYRDDRENRELFLKFINTKEFKDFTRKLKSRKKLYKHLSEIVLFYLSKKEENMEFFLSDRFEKMYGSFDEYSLVINNIPERMVSEISVEKGSLIEVFASNNFKELMTKLKEHPAYFDEVAPDGSHDEGIRKIKYSIDGLIKFVDSKFRYMRKAIEFITKNDQTQTPFKENDKEFIKENVKPKGIHFDDYYDKCIEEGSEEPSLIQVIENKMNRLKGEIAKEIDKNKRKCRLKIENQEEIKIDKKLLMDLYSSLFGLEYGFLNNKFYDPQKHAGTDKYISEKQNVIINGLIKFCESKKRARSIEKIYDYLISIKAEKECENFYKIKVVSQSSNPLENLLINHVSTMSCTEGPGGLYKEAAVLSEICPNVGKIYLQSYSKYNMHNEDYPENIGVAYILKCWENGVKKTKDEKVWMIDGVETGVAVGLIKEDLWKEYFYKGIYQAAEDVGIKRIIFNLNVKSRRAKEFVWWLCTNKEITKYKKGQPTDYISPNRLEEKEYLPGYSLTLCNEDGSLDSENGEIKSLAKFGGKQYAEAWFKRGVDDDAFNCCDSEYLGRKVKGIEVRVE